MSRVTQQQRSLAIQTPLAEDDLVLRQFSSSEDLGRLFTYELDLASDRPDISFTEILGRSVTVRLDLPDEETRFFNGIVSRFANVGQSGRYFSYHATVVPQLWLLTRAANCRIFQDLTIPQIIETVLSDRGLAQCEKRLSRSYHAREYCVQYRETDFDFISRLMEQEGIYYFFEHVQGQHTLVLADAIGAHKPYPGFANVRFRASDQGGVHGTGIHEWRREDRLQPGVYELKDFDFQGPAKPLLARSGNFADHPWNTLPIYDYPGEYLEEAQGRECARVRLEQIQATRHVFTGRATARGLAAGHTFTLTECAFEEFNRNYLVTKVNYAAQSDDFDSRPNGSLGEFCSASVEAIEADVPFRASSITPKPVVQGPQTAIVVGKPGEEIWTDKFGRIKVKFHWDRQAQGDEKSSCWIRVAQNWAGKKWGAFFLPRVGQEVIVEFLEGDPDRPIVTGCVYNGSTPTPYELPAQATKSTIKTNSSKGGDGCNELRFEDKKGEEQIFIHGQRDLDVRVRNDVRETNYGNREVRVGWEKDGARGGNLNLLVRENAHTHVEGSQFERIEKQLNQSVGQDVVEEYQKNQSTFVKDALTLNAKEIVIEGATVLHQKSGKIALEGVQAVHIKGASVAIEGSTAISLKVGGNFVSITSAGVAINGTMVMINSGGASLPVETAKGAAAAQIQPPREPRQADTGKVGEPSPAASPLPPVRSVPPQSAGG